MKTIKNILDEAGIKWRTEETESEWVPHNKVIIAMVDKHDYLLCRWPNAGARVMQHPLEAGYADPDSEWQQSDLLFFAHLKSVEEMAQAQNKA